jgi:hypothetical protein
MMQLRSLLLVVVTASLALAACDSGTRTPMGGSDGAIGGGGGDARSTGALPAWQLEDVQPQSPRTGQTYGLDTFANKIVVAVLLEGF